MHFSRGAATVNSQGRKPLEKTLSEGQSPGGAVVADFDDGTFATPWLLPGLSTRLRPWLLTVAAPRLKFAVSKRPPQRATRETLARALPS